MELQLFFRYLCANWDFSHGNFAEATLCPENGGTPAIGLLALIPSHGFAWPKRSLVEGLSCSQHDFGGFVFGVLGMEAITIHGMVYLPTFGRFVLMINMGK